VSINLNIYQHGWSQKHQATSGPVPYKATHGGLGSGWGGASTTRSGGSRVSREGKRDLSGPLAAWLLAFLRAASLRMAASGRAWQGGHAGLNPLRRAPGASQ
jgi:hypothetical protein